MADRVEEELVGNREVKEIENGEWVQKVGKEPKKTPEVEGYIEEVEKAGEKAGPVPTDDQGQPVVQQVTQPQDDTQLPDDAVVLPMTQAEFEEGLHQPLVRAARWLAEWCSYLIKKLGARVFFRG